MHSLVQNRYPRNKYTIYVQLICEVCSWLESNLWPFGWCCNHWAKLVPHFWRTVLLVIVILAVRLFSFSTFSISAHCLLAFGVSNELIILLRIPCMWWLTSFLLLSKFFCFFIFWQLDYNVSWYGSLWFHSTWSLLHYYMRYNFRSLIVIILMFRFVVVSGTYSTIYR